jgi:two-component system, NarL family, sensor histidine kinase UhpB
MNAWRRIKAIWAKTARLHCAAARRATALNPSAPAHPAQSAPMFARVRRIVGWLLRWPGLAAGLLLVSVSVLAAAGPSAELASEQLRRTFWNVSVAHGLAIVLAVLGAAVLLLDSWNRRSSHLRPFGWLALGWSALSLRSWLGELPLAGGTVEFVVAAAFAPVASAAMLFLLRLAGRRWRQFEKWLLPQCLLMPLTLLLAGPSRLSLASAAWNALLGLELLAVVGQYLWLTRRQPRVEYWPMAAALVMLVGTLGVEFAVQRAWLAPPALDTTQLILTLLAIGMGTRLLGGFSRALQAAELGRRRLEARAIEIATEAERNFTQMADARIEQVTAQERKRIAADLHDDLGAKLLTIVHTSDSERISTLAREALEEMRLSVRGLTGKPMQLADALADWRAEVVARLGQANIEIDWRGPAEEVEQTLPARSFVQTTRILRESVSNIIKHSGATSCKVRCAMHDGEFGLIVQDNGRGIPMELDGKLDRGHGMTSMKHRAKQMQGQCLVESAPGYGTVIRLTLPL